MIQLRRFFLCRGVCAKSEAATFFSRFVEVGLRKIREALDAAFFPVAIMVSSVFIFPHYLVFFDNPSTLSCVFLVRRPIFYRNERRAGPWLQHAPPPESHRMGRPP